MTPLISRVERGVSCCFLFQSFAEKFGIERSVRRMLVTLRYDIIRTMELTLRPRNTDRFFLKFDWERGEGNIISNIYIKYFSSQEQESHLQSLVSSLVLI